MKEGTLADVDYDFDESDPETRGLTSSAAFPALVALWFAALFGGGCLFLPPVLFDMIFGGNSPFGEQTRIVLALGAAGIGLLMGLFIASRVRGSDDASIPAPKPERTSKARKSGARPPLDVRAALGLRDHDDDDDEDEWDEDIADTDDLDLTDEISSPIDDPHFASAWSDSGSYDDEADEEPEAASAPLPNGFSDTTEPEDDWHDFEEPAPAPVAETPAPEPRPSRYNPFADFAASAVDEPEEPEWSEPAAAEPPSAPPAAPTPKPSAPAHLAPPPPPAWPEPRAEEPALKELGVAELVERLARALQSDASATGDREPKPQAPVARQRAETFPPQSHESALAQKNDVDRALRSALDRLSRLDDVA